MFSEFLLGILLLTTLVMVVLLVAPRPNDDIRADRFPVVGVALFVVLAVLAFAGGLAISS